MVSAVLVGALLIIVGGDVTLIGSDIDLNAGVSGAPSAGQVSHYRGAVDVTRGQVVWTGDIVLRSFARGYY